jgi:hypothetical protein
MYIRIYDGQERFFGANGRKAQRSANPVIVVQTWRAASLPPYPSSPQSPQSQSRCDAAVSDNTAHTAEALEISEEAVDILETRHATHIQRDNSISSPQSPLQFAWLPRFHDCTIRN